MSVNVDEILAQATEAVLAAHDLNQLDQVRVHYLGKKGFFTEQMKQLGALDPDQRRAVGQVINQAKDQFQAHVQAKKEALENSELEHRLANESIDVSLPGRGQSVGGLHPVTTTLRRISKIFASVGFNAVEGPEIEDDYHNFGALNIPEHHPARAMHDTFYFDAHTVLRTHTSPVQIRVMEVSVKPPLKVIAPGRVSTAAIPTSPIPQCSIRLKASWSIPKSVLLTLKASFTSFYALFLRKISRCASGLLISRLPSRPLKSISNV